MQRIDLNGLWDFVIDLDPKYHDDRTIHREPCYARPNWDRRYWQKVPVPGVWNKYSERLDIYEGVCWFAREFSVPSKVFGDRPACPAGLKAGHAGLPIGKFPCQDLWRR